MESTCDTVLENEGTLQSRSLSFDCTCVRLDKCIYDCKTQRLVTRFFQFTSISKLGRVYDTIGNFVHSCKRKSCTFCNQKFFCSKAILIWRRWLSAHYVNRWLSSKCYYRETGLGNLDNPDQRIAQDLQLFPALTINMIFDFIDSIGSLGVFSVILWKLSDQYIILGYHVP